MRLSWNEIRARAHGFARDWATAYYEKGETQSFYNDFFEIFGTSRRSVARYEEQVKKLNDKNGFIDLFWPKTLLVEQKSAGRDLTKAREQAGEYFDAIRESDKPRYQLLCDFQSFELLDRDTREEVRFTLPELPQHVERFGFIMGVQQRSFRDQDPVNIEAAELMGNLHDALKDSGYTGHDLELFLVRTVFCLFADDTDIFQRDIFLNLLEDRTAEDGSDLGNWLSHLFQVLDTPEKGRQSNLDEDLAKFPYINGELFGQPLRIPAFDSSMREALIEAANFNWSEISPAIFGSLFQSVMNPKERRAQGAHYTTEKNIQKVIKPLFLDGLRAEFERLKARRDTRRRSELERFQQRLGSLTFLDPACGCGNFLIIAYRELRALEIEVLTEIHAEILDRLKGGVAEINVSTLSVVDVDQFYGIEVGEFPGRIAETALWMMDHIMNNRLSAAFGRAFARIPLKKSPHIWHGNQDGDALEVDWADLLPPEQCSYVLGNPPFIGAKYQTVEQRAQVRRIANLGGSGGTLDYVCGWFLKAGAYVQAGGAPIGFVSTNSITQGEQVAQLWPLLFDRYRLEIAFAHRTFAWGSDARGMAHVHVVIIGLAKVETAPAERRLFSYEQSKDEPFESSVKAISPYLFDASSLSHPKTIVYKRSRPLDRLKPVENGNIAADGGNLVFNQERRDEILAREPDLADLIKEFVGAQDLVNGNVRYCFWLVDCDSARMRKSTILTQTLKAVQDMRLASKKDATVKKAKTPYLFTERRQPESGRYLAIPRTASVRRDYLPVAFLSSDVIAANDLQIVPHASNFELALLSSTQHITWARVTSGRLKSDPRYSVLFSYNTFPLPPVSAEEMERVLTPHAEAVLAARANHPDATLADLYDPLTMPQDLRRAHTGLDKVVDRLYRRQGFASERERVEHLFMLYERLQAPLTAAASVKPKSGRRKAGANAAGDPG